MSKKNIVTENEDFKYLEENFEEMMREMEKDKETHDYQIPQIWDYDFRKTIDETLKTEQRKRSKKRMRNLSIAAGIALVTLVGVDRSLVVVQGDGIKEVVEGVFEFENKNVVTFGTTEETTVEEIEESESCFDTTSLEMAYEQIRNELKMPMFYISYVPEGYKLVEARYDKVYRVLNMKFEKKGKWIYISQQQISDLEVTGVIFDEVKYKLVNNESLNDTIAVYKSEQDESLAFSVKKEPLVFNCRFSEGVTECEKFIEGIYFR